VAGSNGNSQDEITFYEFVNDFDSESQLFLTYNLTDIVYVVDKVETVQYLDDEKVTHIWLESLGTCDVCPNVKLIGDASSKYRVGDELQFIFRIGGNDTSEYYFVKSDEISFIEKAERDEEIKGFDFFAWHFDLPEALDNDFGRFLITMMMWVLVGMLAVFILDPIVHAFVKKSETQIDDIILSIIRKPVLILIILYGLVNSLEQLHLPDFVMDYFYTIYNVGFILMMTWIGIKIFKGVLIQLGKKWASKTKKKLEHVLIPVIEKIGSIIILLFGLMTILGYFGIDLGLVLAGSMVMGLIIAFAAQDTLSNFFGGIFLIVEPNFKEGDVVKVSDDYYEVKKIGVRTTKLYDIFKHIVVVVPNNILANEPLVNLTEPDRKMKYNLSVGVAYGVDTHKVEKILLELANKHPDIITEEKGRAPFVRFQSFGDSALDFYLYFWVKDLDDRFRVKHDINHQIHSRFEKEGIEIPFPQRVVTMINQT
jgi:small-conductance mechanosensitive channel